MDISKPFINNKPLAKKRTYYRMTEAGLLFYKEKCREWELTKEVMNRFIKEEFR